MVRGQPLLYHDVNTIHPQSSDQIKRCSNHQLVFCPRLSSSVPLSSAQCSTPPLVVDHVGPCITYDITRGAGGRHVGREKRTTTKLNGPSASTPREATAGTKSGRADQERRVNAGWEQGRRCSNRGPWRSGVSSPQAKRPPQPQEAASPTVLDPPMATKDSPRPILVKGSRQLQTARPSRVATGGDTASNSDNGDGAASETRTASETPGSAIVMGISCLA